MADEPFYPPNVEPLPSIVPRPAEHLWSLRKCGVTWDAQLRYHGEYGVEAQILRQGELVIGRRFNMRAPAVEWADKERLAIEASL
jgi:hypothetical protein